MNKWGAIEILECFKNETTFCGNTECECRNPQCREEREEAFTLAIEALRDMPDWAYNREE